MGKRSQSCKNMPAAAKPESVGGKGDVKVYRVTKNCLNHVPYNI